MSTLRTPEAVFVDCVWHSRVCFVQAIGENRPSPFWRMGTIRDQIFTRRSPALAIRADAGGLNRSATGGEVGLALMDS